MVPVAVPKAAPPAADTTPIDAHPGFNNPPAVASIILSPETEEIEMLPHSGALVDEADEPPTEAEPSPENGKAVPQPDPATPAGEEGESESEESGDEEIELDADGLRSVESCIAKFFKIPENEAGERPCWVCQYVSCRVFCFAFFR
jgi:hypothetical protein